MMTSSSVIILLAATSIAVASLVVDDGNASYVYKAKNVEISLETAPGMGELAAACNHAVYSTDWFTLHPGGGHVFHRFPDHSPVTLTYSDMIAGFQRYCSGVVKVASSDLREFARSPSGGMTTQLGGKTVTLTRQWAPLTSGRFMTNSPTSLIKQQFDIYSDGYVYVRFRCDLNRGDTGYMLYRLTLRKDGNGRYELTRARTGYMASILRLAPKMCAVYSCGHIMCSFPRLLSLSTGHLRFIKQDLSEELILSVAMPNAFNFSFCFAAFLKFLLVIYLPGLYVQYTHMLHQRKKQLGGDAKKTQ
ncbi:hypothetical protein FOL46_008843 [Perkinsus olseni]|uniref:very-long-chain (3R)-3-hydroxyacyl-CoA dehydratase n=1 Tax=Perkinsus olseni TaxID=32597 RepID=A0A7J6L4T3_PEROL|nr:hypothetical protein FOL46_008843 [Perkinsus olseni]